MEFDTTPLRSLSTELNQVGGRIGGRVSQALRKTARDIERDGKQMTAPRIDTGFMRDSISTEITGTGNAGAMEAEVGPTAEYAKYQHDGTATIAPHPFMDRAADRNEPGFYAAMEQLAGGVL